MNVMIVKGIEIKTGDRLYNHGDMANIPKFGEIKGFETSKWGSFIIVQWENNENTSKVQSCILSPEYKGNGLTRIVTEKAYDNFVNERMAFYETRA